MRFTIVPVLAILLSGAAHFAEALEWVRKPALAYDERARKWYVTFELDALSDVEASIIDRQSGRVVRHLAAGVLGPNPPGPLMANSLAQTIEWDGRDDYRAAIDNPRSLAVRVRAGLGVSLEQIVGGDPYAYYSDEMGDHDHSPWGIGGLEGKADGKVYVWGHSSNLGPPALRQYDIDGNYLQTLFPLPAGKAVESMRGWGIHVKPDGTYVPKYNRVTDPSQSTTFLDGNLQMARLLPTPDRKRLTFWRTGLNADSFDLMAINADGTLPNDPAVPPIRSLVENPPLPLGPVAPNSHELHSLTGPVFTCFAPDGKSFYLSGVFAARTRYGSILEVLHDNFWRDGQIWKVDLETRTARPFFALDVATLPEAMHRTKVLGGRNTYAALHGVTVDLQGRVFVADRLNQRIVVLDSEGTVLSEIPVEYPDAVALSTRTGALYVTTRFGDEHLAGGAVALVKFNNWHDSNEPAATIPLSTTGYSGHHQHSYVVLCDTDQATNVWVAHTRIPVRVFRDDGKGLTLLKDFSRGQDRQRCLGFDRLEVDPMTETAYLLDDHDAVWKVSDWRQPRFVKLPLETSSIAIDPRRRHLYLRTLRDGSSSNAVGRVARFHLDRDDYPAVDYGDTQSNRITPPFQSEWCFEGNSDRGLAVAPNGNIAVVGDRKDGLRVFFGSDMHVPWEATTITPLPNNAGGVRFDFAGNLYVGHVDEIPADALPGFEHDRHIAAMGRIHKYAPTGTLESGNLFFQPPSGPSHTYDVPYGAFETQCVTRSPRFGIDGFGRIYYPTNIVPRVTIMDNAGNEILHFGTYGNRDSTGGLPGDLVPANGIPMAFPNSVDATDEFIYVADMVNLRLLRLKKTYQAVADSR